MVYAGGHVSGAHYNPAVTLAILVRGKIRPPQVPFYITAQFCGAFVGGVFACILEADLPGESIGYPVVAAGVGWFQALLCEIIITFALCHTVLHVATTTAQANNSYFGLAIGFTVLSGAISVGGISGGCFNPAVAMLSIIRGKLGDLLVHILGPLLGGAAAGGVFRLTNPEECGGQSTDNGEPQTTLAKINPRACGIEFIGTFLLCFTVACAAAQGGALVPLSIGAMLMGQVYAGGATSGANYNPAVSLGLLVRMQLAGNSPACQRIKESFPPHRCGAYVVVQCFGALFAGLFARYAVAGSDFGDPWPAMKIIGHPYPG